MHLCAVAALFLSAPTTPAQAADLAYQRVVEFARNSPILPADIVEDTVDACETALCFAETLAGSLPDLVLLEPVDHPDTDTIRWVTTRPSVAVGKTYDTLKLQLTRFGRKAVAELREALAGAGGRLLVDLRGNEGGDIDRMLQVAGLLLGSRRDVVEIDHGNRIERRSLDGPLDRGWQVDAVMVDRQTASAALLLVRLIQAFSEAEVRGPSPDEGPVFLKRRLPIDHDWRLILPVAEVSIVEP